MPGPAVQATTLVMQLARDLRTALDQHFARLGLTTQQAALLIHIVTGVDSPTQLADLLGTDTAAITRLIDRLEKKGLANRESGATDRRAVTIGLTDAGRNTVPQLPPIFETVGAQLVRGMSPAAVVADLRTMAQNIHQH